MVGRALGRGHPARDPRRQRRAMARRLVKLSLIIPARDESAVIEPTLDALVRELAPERVDCEFLVVDDGSTDGTGAAVARVAARDRRVRLVRNDDAHGFGRAVRRGLEEYTGDAVVI